MDRGRGIVLILVVLWVAEVEGVVTSLRYRFQFSLCYGDCPAGFDRGDVDGGNGTGDSKGVFSIRRYLRLDHLENASVDWDGSDRINSS